MPKKPKPPIKNMGASVRSRLLNLSKQRRQPFDLLLNNHVLERLLYRLSQTQYRDRFILKGAMLLTKCFEDPLRPTRDLDFLGIGNDDQDEIVRILQEVCGVSYNDGVVFDKDSIKEGRGAPRGYRPRCSQGQSFRSNSKLCRSGASAGPGTRLINALHGASVSRTAVGTSLR
jgi:hypothetical protein